MGIIYLLKFSSGKSYIGITRGTAEGRYRSHARAARYPKHKKYALYRAWRKYGAPSMTILAIVPNERLCAEEVRWIKQLKTQSPDGYNITPGGEASPALVPEVAKKISKSRTGMKFSDEHRLNLSISHIGLPNPNKGKPLLPERLKALQAGHARYLLTEESPEVRRKKAEGGKHKLSAESRAKVSTARKAYWAARKANEALLLQNEIV